MKTNWIYFGVFLNEQSAEFLKKMTLQLLESDLKSLTKDGDWKLYCHHMTIAFNNHTQEAISLYRKYEKLFGREIELTATHIGISNDALAIKIDYDGDSLNKIPHITLATPISGRPFNSNNISSWKKLSTPIKLKGYFSQFLKH